MRVTWRSVAWLRHPSRLRLFFKNLFLIKLVSHVFIRQTHPFQIHTTRTPEMSSYNSEGLFLSSLPRAKFHDSLSEMLLHCGQFSGTAQLFHLSQSLLLNIGEFEGPQYEMVVRRCTESLRRLPDPEGHIGHYARHVEQCCLE